MTQRLLIGEQASYANPKYTPGALVRQRLALPWAQINACGTIPFSLELSCVDIYEVLSNKLAERTFPGVREI